MIIIVRPKNVDTDDLQVVCDRQVKGSYYHLVHLQDDYEEQKRLAYYPADLPRTEYGHVVDDYRPLYQVLTELVDHVA